MSADLSSFFDTFFSEILRLILWTFSTLDSITIKGVSLLDYSIALLILSALLPIVLSLVNTGYSSSHGYYTSQKRKAESDAKYVKRRAENQKGG